jgi:UDP-glucose 4-epimerase
MKRVAVTGGAGFIGSNLVIQLISKGYAVTVVDDLSTGLLSNISDLDLDFRQISITDFDKLQSALMDSEVIFHLAARGSVPRSIINPTATHNVNVNGTVNVLEIAKKNKSHVIFSSSSSVYGRNLALPKEENMWLGPTTPYAASKLAGESYLEAYAHSYQIPVTILRFFNVFGPRQRPDHQYAAVLPKWIWLAMHEQPIEVFGDGTASRDFTYVDTVVSVAIEAMEKKIETEGAVNLAYGNRIMLNDCIEMLKTFFPHIEVNYVQSRLGDIKDSQNLPTLLNQTFPGVIPKSFESALEETVQWLLAHGKSVADGPALIE